MRIPKELTLTVEEDEETGVFVASWSDPEGGGITTQADSFDKLQDAVLEALRCHFANRPARRKVDVALHFEKDPVLELEFA
jgi:predicted RNase H-like HicB family nuclease